MKTWMRTAFLVAAVAAGGVQSDEAPAPQDTTPPLLLTDAHIIDGSGRAPYLGNVLIAQGRIQAIGPDIDIPSGVRILQLPGRWLVPGFTDMHAHVTFLHGAPGDADPGYDRAVSEQVLKILLAYGITTVRNPAAPAVEGVRLRDDVARGAIPGPRILTAGEAINWRHDSTEAGLRAEVARQAAAGVDYIKAYASLAPPQLAVVVDESHRHGLKVIGHLQDTDWPTAAALGIDQLAHAVSWSASALPPAKREEYEARMRSEGPMKARIFWLESVDVNGPEMDQIIDALVQHHIPVDPTLVAYETKFVPLQKYRGAANLAEAPEALRQSWQGGGPTADWMPRDYARMRRAWPKMLQIVARYHRAGVLLTTGSDLPNPWVAPGVSLHQEMELLAQAGIPPADILAMSTRDAALALGLEQDSGTLAPGKRADLVVLRADPLRDIRNTRRIEYVIRGGQPLRPAALLASTGVAAAP